MVHSLVMAIRRVPWWVWLIVAVALVPRLLLVPYGLPYELDPDERWFVDAAWQMVADGDGDPEWYAHPASTFMDAVAALFAVYGATGVAVGEFDSVAAVGDAHLADISHLFTLGRLASVVTGIAAVLMTYVVARKLRISPFWATTAALLIAVSPIMIQFSALVRADMLMVALLLATVLMSIRALIRPSSRRFAIAGAAIGLAAASKYPGALGVVPLVAANATLTIEHRITPRHGLLLLALAGVAGALAAFVVGPYLFLHVGSTLHYLGLETQVTGNGETDVLNDAWRFLSETLPSGIGGAASVVGLGGLVMMLTGRRSRILSVTFWPYLALISALAASWERWALPLLPLAAIGASWLIYRMQLRVGPRIGNEWATVAAMLVAALMLWYPLSTTLSMLPAHVNGDDTRLRANEWVYENIPPGSTILVDSYSVQVSSDDYDVRLVDFGEIVSWSETSDKARPDGYFNRLGGQWIGSTESFMAAIEAAGIEYIALSDVWIDLFRAQGDVYSQVVERYDTLLETYPVVVRIDNDAAQLGSPVTILARLDPEARLDDDVP